MANNLELDKRLYPQRTSLNNLIYEQDIHKIREFLDQEAKDKSNRYQCSEDDIKQQLLNGYS